MARPMFDAPPVTTAIRSAESEVHQGSCRVVVDGVLPPRPSDEERQRREGPVVVDEAGRLADHAQAVVGVPPQHVLVATGPHGGAAQRATRGS